MKNEPSSKSRVGKIGTGRKKTCHIGTGRKSEIVKHWFYRSKSFYGPIIVHKNSKTKISLHASKSCKEISACNPQTAEWMAFMSSYLLQSLFGKFKNFCKLEMRIVLLWIVMLGMFSSSCAQLLIHTSFWSAKSNVSQFQICTTDFARLINCVFEDSDSWKWASYCLQVSSTSLLSGAPKLSAQGRAETPQSAQGHPRVPKAPVSARGAPGVFRAPLLWALWGF